MPSFGDDGERQFALDFGSVRAEHSGEMFRQSGIVISFTAHFRPAKSLLEPSPAVERLLSEAKRLKW
jgi:hypothetical protein